MIYKLNTLPFPLNAGETALRHFAEKRRVQRVQGVRGGLEFCACEKLNTPILNDPFEAIGLVLKRLVLG